MGEQNVKMFVLQVNTHRKASTLEETVYNHVDKITWPVHLSQPSSLDMRKLAEWAHEYVYGGRDEGYKWAQQHRFQLKKGPLVTTASQ